MDVDNGGGCLYLRAGDMWEISVPTTQFCSKCETALKIKPYFLNWEINKIVLMGLLTQKISVQISNVNKIPNLHFKIKFLMK